MKSDARALNLFPALTLPLRRGGDLPSLRKPRLVVKDWLFLGFALAFHSSLLAVDWALR